MIRRREFIAGLGSASAWPLVARAQQGNRMRRIGVLIGGNENISLAKPLVSALMQTLADLGWADGRDVRTDLRWTGDDIRLLDRDLKTPLGGRILTARNT